MPERVRTRFDEDGNVVPAGESVKQQDAVESAYTKKRRHDGSLVTLESADCAQAEMKKQKSNAAKEQRIAGPHAPASQRSLQKQGVHKDLKNKQNHQQAKSSAKYAASTPTTSSPHTSLATRRAALVPVRKALPIWSHQSSIRSAMRNTDILLLIGETGSGKSTQVPQFLLTEPWCKGRIAVTQPRRVAAISLARRVAEEMGTTLGTSSPASKVGYSVRFDTQVAKGTRVKFLTEGMLLQEMLRDPLMEEYSCVVVDEVHERSVNVDMVMGFLRRIVSGQAGKRKGGRLKVVVMSATAEESSLVNFFEEGYREVEPTRQSEGDVAANGDSIDEHVSELDSGVKKVSTDGPSSQPQDVDAQLDRRKPEDASRGTKANTGGQDTSKVATCHIEGRQYPVKTVYLPEPTQDFVESALKCIFQIHYKEPLPGDILVFMTGQDTIESLEQLVNEYAASMGPEVPKLLTLPLFAALPQASQQKIFLPAPPKTRKLIISTNIAETSVTVPGVRFVIDSGKVKIKQFRNRLGLDSLLVKPISQSSATQRKGRAGREAPGVCYRLYTEKDYKELEKNARPEILRTDLSHALLLMKARGVHDVLRFPFVSPPPRDALEKALLHLLQLRALDSSGEITPAGCAMAKFPLAPPLARVLIEAAGSERDCLAEAIDVVAALNVENVFLNLTTEEKKEQAEEARKALLRREGDHLTLLTTVRGYAAENVDRRDWAERHWVSHRAMQNVMDIRKQLHAQCKQLKLLPPSATLSAAPISLSTSLTEALLQSVLSGFAANTARLMPDGSYRTLAGNHLVAIHPASVLFGKKVEAIVFSEFVYTNRSYARGVSAVRLEWVGRVLEEREGE